MVVQMTKLLDRGKLLKLYRNSAFELDLSVEVG